MAHLKGQKVNIYRLNAGGGPGDTDVYEVLAQASKSCDFSLTPNTTDGASKADANPMWDNPIFTYCDWSMSNESFVVSAAQLNTLIQLMIAGTPVDVLIDTDQAGIKKAGKAIITSLDVDAPADDYASLSISLEGASALTTSTATLTAESASVSKMKGKSLMIAYNTATTGAATYHTLCAATSHKLSISAQTADTKTKDSNDLAISKEVTGFSMSLSTENLVYLKQTGDTGIDAATLLEKALTGATLPLTFGYYSSAAGAAAEKADWGAATTLNVTANCICSSYSISAANKENVTMSAEFQNQGMPTFATA